MYSLCSPLLATFENWGSDGSAVFLKNKVILTPQNFDRSGLIYNNWELNFTNWEVQVDLQIQNSKRSQLAKGFFYFYLIRDNPQKSPQDFARGLNGLINGLMIEIKEHHSRLPVDQQYDLVEGAAVANLNKHHEIVALVTNENRHPINNRAVSRCLRFQYDFTLKIRYQNGELIVSTKAQNETDYRDCFQIQTDLNYEGFMFMAANSGKAVNNRHTINGIRTYDLDKQIDDRRNQAKEEEFSQTGKNIFEKSQEELKDVVEQYNKQLIRHSNIFSQLVGEFVSNNQKILEILSLLPKTSQHSFIYKSLIDNEAQIDKLTTSVKNVIAQHQKSFSIPDASSSAPNLDQVKADQRSLTVKLGDSNAVLTTSTNNLNNDQLIDIIGKDKKHLQSKGSGQAMTQSDFEEEDVEIQIEKIINLMIEGGKDKVKTILETDDFVDYIIISVLILVAVGGIIMWRKLQEQKQRILL